jgi:DNA-binding transcriptional ArsR family regulator
MSGRGAGESSEAMDLSLTFGALADPSRREMLRLLRRGEMRVTEIAAPFALSLNAVSKHVQALERAGLVRRRVRGREHFIGLAPEPMQAASAFLEEYREFWEGRLDALEEMFVAERSSTESNTRVHSNSGSERTGRGRRG